MMAGKIVAMPKRTRGVDPEVRKILKQIARLERIQGRLEDLRVRIVAKIHELRAELCEF